ncbi:ABC transporter ATP-binding protein [Pseudonocardia hispaniensis]|uniref:ABC transporter ATP-binding protein n=1 Tax=Pseudonocardia hispaniensis TaxID=904933 RepID=A0ABW1IYP6_9PSEU
MTKAFGGVIAVNDVDIHIQPEGVTALIGPNGAGKTTLFNLISGAVSPSKGTVELAGKDITRLSVAERAKLGMSRTFQTPQLFASLTVLENVVVSRSVRLGSSYLADLLGVPARTRRLRKEYDVAFEVLGRFGVDKFADEYPQNLPYGHQRRVEIARAVASEPRVILLDEPLAGLNATESAELGDLFIQLGRSGTAVVLVEHDVGTVMRVSDSVYVLENGGLIAYGTPEQVQQNPAVMEAYLGRGFAGVKQRSGL